MCGLGRQLGLLILGNRGGRGVCSGFGIRSLGVGRILLCWCRGVGGALLALRGRLCRGRAGRFGGDILLPWLLDFRGLGL